MTNLFEHREILLERKSEIPFEKKLDKLKVLEKANEIVGMHENQQIRDQYKKLIANRDPHCKEIPDDLRHEMSESLQIIDAKYAVNGVHFLKSQFSKIVDALRQGRRVEFEGFGPYLRDYIFQGIDSGEITFTKTDQIGLAIMEFLRAVLPEAHPVSLYDEYNMWMTAADPFGRPMNRDNEKELFEAGATRGRIESVADGIKKQFRDFVERVMRSRGIIKDLEKEGADADFVLLSESEKIRDAEELVKLLDEKGLIERGRGSEIWFQTTVVRCDDPRYMRIRLRDDEGHWECAALDSSGFLNPRNREIVHLVILPKENFEEQQDQVWEILHAIGFRPENYHNIFFETENSEVTPESSVNTLRSKLSVLL